MKLILTTIAAVLLVGCGDQEKDNALLDATIDGDIEAVKECFEKGANINAKNKDGRCPLHLAALMGYDVIAEFLIAKGSDVNSWDKNGKTALDLAQGETADFLIRHGGKTGTQLASEYREKGLPFP